MKIHVFDFDGTLTTCDTLLAFIRHARGRWALAWGLLLYSPLLVAMKLHLIDNGHVKERFFSHFFRGMLERDFDTLCQDFARQHTDFFRTEGLKTIERALDNGDEVVIVSASVDRWVRPCLEQFIAESERFVVMGTEIEIVNGRLTGRFSTLNCYGPEKLRRLKEYLGGVRNEKGRTKNFIIAYGDSRGDRELLAYADEQHYKPFS